MQTYTSVTAYKDKSQFYTQRLGIIKVQSRKRRKQTSQNNPLSQVLSTNRRANIHPVLTIASKFRQKTYR